MNNIFYFAFVGIIVVVSLYIILKILIKKFNPEESKVKLYGTLQGMSNREIISISCSIISYVFMIYLMASFIDLDIYIAIIVLFLTLVSGILIKNKKVIIDLILSAISLVGIKVVYLIHDYIINHTEYDKLKYENKNDDTYKSNTAYGVLIEGYGTCNGYADAMEIFLDKMNIINYKISNEEHIWNLVYLDGKWYHLDLTWDDPISDININRDTYFLINTKTLEKINDGTHTFDKNIYSEAV